jgi:hypothetical protein
VVSGAAVSTDPAVDDPGDGTVVSAAAGFVTVGAATAGADGSDGAVADPEPDAHADNSSTLHHADRIPAGYGDAAAS